MSQADQQVFSAGLYSGQVSSNMGYKTPEQVNPRKLHRAVEKES